MNLPPVKPSSMKDCLSSWGSMMPLPSESKISKAVPDVEHLLAGHGQAHVVVGVEWFGSWFSFSRLSNWSALSSRGRSWGRSCSFLHKIF
jgi:hypothetical protein